MKTVGATHSRALILVLASAAITGFMIYPAVGFPRGLPELDRDVGQMVWNLWIVWESLARGESPLETSMILHPVGANLSTHTLAAGFFPVTALVKLAMGGDAFYPFYAFRLIIYLSFFLNLLLTHRFLHELGFRPDEAVVPTLAFAFCDFFFLHATHLNLVCGFLLPLNGLLILRSFTHPGWRTAFPAAVTLGWTLYFGELFVYVFMGAALWGASMLVSRRDREALGHFLRRLGWPAGLGAVALFCLIISPFVAQWWKAEPLPVDSAFTAAASANLAGFVIPHSTASPAYGTLSSSLLGISLPEVDLRVAPGVAGYETFIGFPILLLAVIGLFAERRRSVTRWAWVGGCFLLLSLGPTLRVWSTDTGWPMPFAALLAIPPFDVSRAPVRFAIAAQFCWTVLAAFGVRSLLARVSPKWSRLLLGAIIFWVLVESWPPRHVERPPELALEKLDRLGGPVLCLPIGRLGGHHAALQTLHHHPISSGFVARPTVEQRALEDRLTRWFLDDSPLEPRLRELGYRGVLVLEPISWFDYRRLESTGLEVVHLVEPPFRAESVTLFGAREPSLRFGQRFLFHPDGRGRYLLHRGWSGNESWGTWSDGDQGVLIFHLEAAWLKQSAPLELRIGARRFEGQEMRLTLNGRPVPFEWTTFGLIAGLPADHLGMENRLTFDFPGARSPASLGQSVDERRLGLGIEWLTLDPV